MFLCARHVFFKKITNKQAWNCLDNVNIQYYCGCFWKKFKSFSISWSLDILSLHQLDTFYIRKFTNLGLELTAISFKMQSWRKHLETFLPFSKHNFLSPQAKRNKIIITRKWMYELSLELTNALRTRILGN